MGVDGPGTTSMSLLDHLLLDAKVAGSGDNSHALNEAKRWRRLEVSLDIIAARFKAHCLILCRIMSSCSATDKIS